MGLYVIEAGYIAYFPDITAAPSDFEYKEQIAVDLFKKELPQPVLIPSEYDLGTYYKNQFDAALYEQIKYFTDNPNLFDQLTTDTTEFKILNYSEKAAAFDQSSQKKRIAPNAWLKLSSINLTYRGVPCFG